jgi:Mce-associated membrane protein
MSSESEQMPENDLTSGDHDAPTYPRRLSVMGLAAVAVLSLILALGGLGAWLGNRVYQEHRSDRLRELFLDAAKQAAVNLTTLDHERADADVQRILDSSIGDFHDDFADRAKPFADAVRKAQSTSEGVVTEAGVESMNADSGQVLLAVTVNTANRGLSDVEPRYWRMRLTVSRVGEAAKVSRVDFVR